MKKNLSDTILNLLSKVYGVFDEVSWKDADGMPVSELEIRKEIIEYSRKGGKIYVGSDSMLMTIKCNFVTVIAFHNRELGIARYYFKKIKSDPSLYRDLQVKIFKEVELAIKTANYVLEICEDAKLEIHIDIGLRARNKTSKYYNLINGWVTGSGFYLKVKPDSWASSLADSHTKGGKKSGNKIKKKVIARKNNFKS